MKRIEALGLMAALTAVGSATAQGFGSSNARPTASQVLEIRLIAEAADGKTGEKFDLAAEKQRLVAWLERDGHRRLISDQPLSIAKFNATSANEGGPSTSRIRWVAGTIPPSSTDPKTWGLSQATRPGSSVVEVYSEADWRTGPTADRRFLVELYPLRADGETFGASDIDVDRARSRIDPVQREPEFEFAMKADRKKAFAEWTGSNVGRQVAFVLNGRVRSAPVLKSAITDVATMRGNFTIGEADELLRVLRLGNAAETTVVGGSSDKIPASADPEDLRAAQGAEAMLEAERKVREMIKSGKISGIDKIVTFEEISSWPYEDGLKGMPKQLDSLNGKHVMMTGFMLPIDEVEDIKEFLLVQSLWACCYGQPPDINGIVRVVMKGKRIDYQFDPIKVVGTFKVVASYEDGYCVDIYQLHADSVEVIK